MAGLATILLFASCTAATPDTGDTGPSTQHQTGTGTGTDTGTATGTGNDTGNDTGTGDDTGTTGAVEICNGVDDNGNGQIDEGLLVTALSRRRRRWVRR